VRTSRAALLALALPVLAGCGGAASASAQPPSPDVVSDSAMRGTESASMIPAGFGTLRQDDIAFRVQIGGKQVRVIPLDESVIRTLSPDSYRALSGLEESRRAQITDLARRSGVRGFSIWYVQYYGLEPDARFSPRDIAVVNLGREFRPVEILPLSSGWGLERLQQRETQTALYLFDQSVDVNQPSTTVSVEGQQASGWTEVLRRIERERSLIRSRASKSANPGA
jgi:hypothetical protein